MGSSVTLKGREKPVIADSRFLSTAWRANMAIFLLHGLVVGTWVSRIPDVQRQLHLSNSVLGVTLLSAAVGAILCIPFAGRFIVARGSKAATGLGTLAFSMVLLLPGFATNAGTLALCLFLYGASAASMDVAMNAQGVEIEKRLGKPVMSRFHAMFSVGAMAGAAFGGVVASHVIPPWLHFAVASFLFVAAALALWPLLIREDQPAHETHQHRLRFRSIPPVLLALTGIAFCMLLAEGAIADWTGIYLGTALHSGPGLSASGYAVFSGAMAFFRLLGDVVTAFLGSFRTVLSGSLLAAVSLSYILLAPKATWAIPAFVLLGAGMSVIIPLAFGSGGRVNGVAPGTGIATVTGLGYFGFIVGPPLIGFLSQEVTLRYALGTVVACCLVTAYLSPMLRSLPAPGAAPAPEEM